MLDRRTIVIISAFLGIMMAAAFWLVGHTSRGSPGPFVAPACVMFVLGVLQWRFARAEGDLSAWRKWGGRLAISYAAICTLFQLTWMMTISKMTELPASSLARTLLASCGLLFIIFGYWMAQLPPLRPRRPTFLSLDAAREAAMLRFGGRLLVPYGLIIIAIALLIPRSLIAPLVGLMSVALFVIVFVKRRRLHNTLSPG